MFQIVLIFHLLGAAVWAGGHLVLAIAFLPGALRRGEIGPLRQFEARFEKVGIPALLVQVVTGIWLARRYVIHQEDWFSWHGTLPAHVTVKFILLGLTLLLALNARLRLLPKLGPENIRWVAAHIIAVTVLAVLFVMVGVGIRTGGLWHS